MGEHVLRLAVRPPYAAQPLLDFLAARAIPGVEARVGPTYRRTLTLPGGTGVLALTPTGASALTARIRVDDDADLAAAVASTRHLADLDADSAAIDAVLGADPLLAPAVAATPGRRVPRTVDAHELALRAVLGQQVSVAAARTLAGRLVARAGEPLAQPDDSTLTHGFPSAAAVAAAHLDGLGLTGARARALRRLAVALAGGEVVLDPGADTAATTAALVALPGIGPWTATYVALRALGDPDAFVPTDLGVRRALERLGRRADPAGALAAAEQWRPYRAYGLVHLWAC